MTAAAPGPQARRRPGRPALDGDRYVTRLASAALAEVDALAAATGRDRSTTIAMLVGEALAARRRRAARASRI